MSVQAPPPKPWETAPRTASSRATDITNFNTTTGVSHSRTATQSAGVTAHAAASQALVPVSATTNAENTAAMTAIPNTMSGGVPMMGMYGMTAMNGMAAMSGPMMMPGVPMAMSPMHHIGSSIQSFGRLSQLLQLNFDAIHASFSSMLRLFDSYAMLRGEMSMIGQTFTTLNLISFLTKRIQRLLALLTGRAHSQSFNDAWSAVSQSSPSVSPSSKPRKGGGFFSGFTWNLLLIAVSWSVLRSIWRWISRRLWPDYHKQQELLARQQQQQQQQLAEQQARVQQQQQQHPSLQQPVDPTNPAAVLSPMSGYNPSLMNPMTGLSGISSMPYSSYSSPYSSLGGYSGYGGMSSLSSMYGGGMNSYGVGSGGYGGSLGYGNSLGYGGGMGMNSYGGGLY